MFALRWKRPIVIGLTFALLAAACSPAATPTTPAATSAPPQIVGDLVIYSGRSESLIAPVIEKFKARHAEVNVILKAGSNSELANALLEEKANPQADLFITTEVLTAQKLANEGVFQPYQSPNAADLPAEYRHPEGLWNGITLRARVIMYNTNLVSPEEAPKSMFDLTDPKWKGQIASAGSANGSFQAQVAAMRQLAGDEATEQWLTGLLANEVTFFGGHTDVRNAVGAGEFKIGLVNHYYYHLQKAEGSPVGVVYPDQGDGQMGVIVNATAAGIVQGAKHVAAAQAFVDYLLSAEGQQAFAELNYEYPLRPGVTLHPEVASLSSIRLAKLGGLAAIANSLDSTLDLIEKAGIQ
jgi:iron(III) transport system substrate-binding protein